jgi:biopolymer transport protein TolQ
MDIPVLEMMLRSGWVARSILLILAVLSLISWAVVFNRLFYLRRISSLNKRFRILFEGLKSFKQLEKVDTIFNSCPLGKLGKVSLTEYKRIISDAQAHRAVKDWSFYLQNQFNMATERINTVVAHLSSKLDHGVFLLATVSSIAPFLGLLGTVWGIMNSFFEIGNQGSASLPVVAPGIAEALITTIVGLAVAIPAAFFYNIFMHRAERIEDEMDEFGDQLMLRLKRELFNVLYGDSPLR